MRLGIALLALLLFTPITGHAQQPTPAPKCPIAQPDPNAIADIDLMPAVAVVPTWTSDPAGLLPLKPANHAARVVSRAVRCR
jgi:hypothetical protein